MRYIGQDKDFVYLKCGNCKKISAYDRTIFNQQHPTACESCSVSFHRIWFCPINWKRIRMVIPYAIMTALAVSVINLMQWSIFQKNYYFNKLVTALSPQITSVLIPIFCSTLTLLTQSVLPVQRQEASENTKRFSGGLWIVMVLEVLVLVFAIGVTIQTQYSSLQIKTDTGDIQQYYGNVVGEIASGNGRLFDSQGNLIYWGGFKDNLYDGYGEEWDFITTVQDSKISQTYQIVYSGYFSEGEPDGYGVQYRYDAEYDFGKDVSDSLSPYLYYEGQFVDGKYCGFGTQYGITSKYEGTFFDGVYQGYGIHWLLDSEDDKVYKWEGSYFDGKLNGSGRKYYSNGDILFEGTYRNNSAVFGTSYFRTGGVRYKGDWNDSQYNGKGTLYWQDGGIRYDGSWSDGNRDGQGSSYSEDGTIEYDGEWKNDRYNGYGISYREDGGLSYAGEWNQGNWDGYGTAYRANGKPLYKGGWSNNNYNGQGEYYFEDGERVRYKGGFRNGKLDGYCIEYYWDGTVAYEGEWNLGSRAGYGVSYRENGAKEYEGGWQNSQYSGWGTEYNQDGEFLREGMFNEGEWVQQSPENNVESEDI